jgi:flavin-dependent dehydrogenase
MSLAATLGLTGAGDRLWDVLVVGAGPAGALAARELARRGAAVLLVDKASFPRWKVCGACLNGWAVATLRAVGLGQLPATFGAVPLHDLRLAARGRDALLPLPGGAALSREVFDAALVEAAVRAGAHFLPQTQARHDAVTDTMRRVALCQGGRESLACARVVLAADGLGGRFLTREAVCHPEVDPGSRLGAGVITDQAPPFYGAGTIFMACGTGGYVGLVRLEDGRLNIAAALDPVRVKQTGGLGKAAAVILGETGFPPVPRLATLPWRGTPLLTRRVFPTVVHRAFLLGDAAGYVEPFTGEGMAWALASAVVLAPLAYHVCRRWDRPVAEQWPLRYRQTVARHQWVCRMMAQVLRRPALIGPVVAALACAPVLAMPLVQYLNASMTVSGLR